MRLSPSVSFGATRQTPPKQPSSAQSTHFSFHSPATSDQASLSGVHTKHSDVFSGSNPSKGPLFNGTFTVPTTVIPSPNAQEKLFDTLNEKVGKANWHATIMDDTYYITAHEDKHHALLRQALASHGITYKELTKAEAESDKHLAFLNG